MTLDEAFVEFTESESYKEIAKQRNSLGGKYRGYLTRYNQGKLGKGAIIELLEANGYVIYADKVEKRKK